MPVTTPIVQKISIGEPDQDHRNGNRARAEHLLRLAYRVIEAQDLVERTERQEQQDETIADDEGGKFGGRHRRPLMMSATRSALAMIVSVGFTAPIEGKKLASAIYRLSISCARQSRFEHGGRRVAFRSGRCPPGARCQTAECPCPDRASARAARQASRYPTAYPSSLRLRCLSASGLVSIDIEMDLAVVVINAVVSVRQVLGLKPEIH